jgi:hypothetical protein
MKPSMKIAFGLFCGILSSCGLLVRAAEKPNVVLIYIDDPGYELAQNAKSWSV